MRSNAALLLFCAAAAFGDSYGWVRSSDRYENPIILALLLESDLDTADAVVAALSERTDGYVEDIIEALLYQHSQRADLLLSAYLTRVTWGPAQPRPRPPGPPGSPGPAGSAGPFASPLSPGPPLSPAALWARRNPRATERLLDALPRMRDAWLRAAVVRMLPDAGTPAAAALLASRLRALAADMGVSGGHPTGGVRHELFAALEAAARIGGEELAPAVIEISYVSRDPEIVAEARRLAAALLQGGHAQ